MTKRAAVRALLIIALVALPNGATAQAQGEAVVRTCTVVSLGAFGDRVHLQCNHNAAPNGSAWGAVAIGSTKPTIVAPAYFATEPGSLGSAVLSVASAALVKGRTLTIVYRLSASDNPGGCQANDCRRLVGVMTN